MVLSSHGIGEPRAVADHPPVDEDGHVLAQRRLVVEHVAARLRVVCEDMVENLAHGAPGGFRLRAGDMALDVGREDDFGHQRSAGWGDCRSV